MKKPEQERSKKISRRQFINLLERVAFVGLVVPKDFHALFLPQVEAPVNEKTLYENLIYQELKGVFPHLEQVVIDKPFTSIAAFMNSYLFWLKRINAMREKALVIQQQSAISLDTIQDSASKVTLFFGIGEASTLTSFKDGVVQEVEQRVDEKDLNSLAAEIIHLYQDIYSIKKGISAICNEGSSTAVHLTLMKSWLEHNLQAQATGNEHEAVLMPIISEFGIVDEPSIQEFNSMLNYLIGGYMDQINNSDLGSYKTEYLGEELLGQSTQYSRRLTFLQNRYPQHKFPAQQYQETIEHQASLFAKTILYHNLSLEQVVILTSFLNHGQDVTFNGADQPIKDAYFSLRKNGLVASPNAWNANKDEYSRQTVEDLAITATFALRNQSTKKNGVLTLEAFMTITSLRGDSTFYSGLSPADFPTAHLLFFITRDNGERVWYQKELDVSSTIPGEESLLYTIELPRKVWLRDGISLWQEDLNGKNMVVRVTQENILDVPLGVFQQFEVKGEFDEAAVVVANSEDSALVPTSAPQVGPSPTGTTSATLSVPESRQAEYDQIKQNLVEAEAAARLVR